MAGSDRRVLPVLIAVVFVNNVNFEQGYSGDDSGGGAPDSSTHNPFIPI
jgi:hypothetical protein